MPCGVAPAGAQLRSMLEAVTYKKELIISNYQFHGSNELWADQVGPAAPAQCGTRDGTNGQTYD